jgi:hypothetical protein
MKEEWEKLQRELRNSYSSQNIIMLKDGISRSYSKHRDMRNTNIFSLKI